MKQPPLHINIPYPCERDWATFPKQGDGKYCSHCSNIVYDFSQMSDDELLRFFKMKPDTHCGRFHNSQLNKDILPFAKRRQLFISGFNKIAAAVFTLLTFRATSSRAELKHLKPVTVLDSNYQSKRTLIPDDIMITGIVTDVHGKPLEKAKVMFDSVEVAMTDKDGKFKFGLKGVDLEFEEAGIANHNLYFSYDSMVTVVRSYHSSMLSANYDVTLYKIVPGNGESHYYTGGVIVPTSYYPLGDLPSLKYKTNATVLSKDSKGMLAFVATKLKQNPGTSIKVQAYILHHHAAISNQRLALIKKYLVDTEGISEDRIITLQVSEEGDANTIDIIQDIR